MSRLLLVWDAPNLDMGLGAILGGRPTAVHRPRFDAVGRWLIGRARELGGETAAVAAEGDDGHLPDGAVEPEATVFTNVVPGTAENIRPWIEALRNVGFAVFAKPKLTDDSDVDPDMLAHIRARHEEGTLAGVVVASADGQNFRLPLEELAQEMPVTVIGFHEHATWAVDNEHLEFVDLEDIPDVFREPLPRVNLDSLPEGGAWLQPFRPLSALMG
ncbi:NYN domain-containing protein [Corynebacterium bovis]|uniref:NYN domain-containing protein n=1 Tax=Corynebacterium bovis TaxID=36808 RepID=A0A3R8R258_9CORY|nr:NYN domain-containing protein [Corynebacterium bovis]MDK8511740.1 NYN domain-containing protein [Corynebacterium bovis]MDN8579938.1 NYN domain-containing protein [Corynebacterium bovis]RRO85120.1 NYN domain-containing protein [Corynebacterium bovis]RRO86716.1 NYN domain-containing protein [Corynebacterium bovis]